MEQPLFILAPPRSFTSITCAMLGQHPDLFGLPETNLFAADSYGQLGKLYRVFRPRLGHGLFRAIAELGLDGQSKANVATAIAWLGEYPRVSTAELMQHLMEWAAPKRVIEKSPLHVFDDRSLQRMKNAFPEAKYLHLTRHPRANCESVFKVSSGVKGREQRAAASGYRVNKGPARIISGSRLHPDTIWLKPHQRILQFLGQIAPEQQMRIRGEDLLADPDTYLAHIVEWLGISSDPDAIERMKHPECSPFACYGPENARMGNDPSFLENPQLRPFQRKPQSLDDSMEWDPDVKFSDDVKKVAALFGY